MDLKHFLAEYSSLANIFSSTFFSFLSMLILEGPPLEFSTASPNESSQCSLNRAKPSRARVRTNHARPLHRHSVYSSIFHNLCFLWGCAGRNPSSVRGSHPSYRSTRAFGRKLTGAYVSFHSITTAPSFHPVNP